MKGLNDDNTTRSSLINKYKSFISYELKCGIYWKRNKNYITFEHGYKD